METDRGSESSDLQAPATLPVREAGHLDRGWCRAGWLAVFPATEPRSEAAWKPSRPRWPSAHLCSDGSQRHGLPKDWIDQPLVAQGRSDTGMCEVVIDRPFLRHVCQARVQAQVLRKSPSNGLFRRTLVPKLGATVTATPVGFRPHGCNEIFRKQADVAGRPLLLGSLCR